MRSVYHQKTHRVEGHLHHPAGLQPDASGPTTLKAQGINDRWETIRTTMSTQMGIATTLRGAGGEQIHIRKSTYPNASQKILPAP